MPLVPRSTIDIWYRRDSWVYRQFKFLFFNPLWKRAVPGGFSLCPYFWLSMFSLAVVKPFVYFIVFIRWLVRLLGLRKVREIPAWVIALVMLCAFALMMLSALVVLGVVYYQAGCLPALVLPLALVIGFAVCLFYAVDKGWTSTTRCRVEHYSQLGAVAAVALALLLEREHFLTVLTGTGHGLAEFGALLWFCVGEVVAWCGRAAVTTWHAVRWFFVWASLWLIIGLGSIVVASFFGWLAMKLTPPDDARPKPEDLKKVRDEVADHLWRMVPFTGSELPSGIFERNFRRMMPGLLEHLVEIYRTPAYMKEANDAVERFTSVWRRILDDRYRRAQEWDAKCSRVTHALGVVLNPIGAVLWFPVKWCAKQVWTFLCMLVAVAKAGKKGACPYLLFTDPPRK